MEQAQPNDLPPLLLCQLVLAVVLVAEAVWKIYLQNGNMHYSFLSMNKQQTSHLYEHHSFFDLTTSNQIQEFQERECFFQFFHSYPPFGS